MEEEEIDKLYEEELKGYIELRRLVDRNIYRIQRLRAEHVPEWNTKKTGQPLRMANRSKENNKQLAGKGENNEH